MSDSITIARQLSIGDIPRRSASRSGGKIAIIDGETTLTFEQFADAVDRTAAALRASGVEQGDRVALLSHNCWQFAVLNFATARCGAVLVPINFMLTAPDIAYIVDDAEPTAFVAEDALVETATDALHLASVTVTERRVIGDHTLGRAEGWASLDDWIDYAGPVGAFVAVGDDDPVRLMYTSGTESQPKGVMLSSRSLISQYVSCIVDGYMSADDIEVHALPLYHCAQLDCFLSVDIYLGATSVIVPSPEPTALLETLERHQATKLFAPPTVWISLLRSDRFEVTDLTSLQKAYYGASPMPVEVLRELACRLPAVRLWNFYGQTELAPVAAVLQPADQLRKAGAAGRPALNVETAIVDDDGQLLPAGSVGEIVHRTPQATSGYFKKPEKTDEAFAGGWFHSGDLGVFDDEGFLTVVDRKKDMIKTGGENVASREVEEAIYQMSGVAEVAVFGTPDPVWIEAVTAVVVPAAGAELDSGTVAEFARSRLAGYKAPKRVILATELPKNPSGKILKRQLRDYYSTTEPV